MGLLRSSSSALLDEQVPERIQNAIRESIEQQDDNRVADLHVWSIGPSIYFVVVSDVTSEPKHHDHYKQLLPDDIGLIHRAIEVHGCPDGHAQPVVPNSESW